MRVYMAPDPRWKRQDRCNAYHARYRRFCNRRLRCWQSVITAPGHMVLLQWAY